jgi:hypothetical protein
LTSLNYLCQPLVARKSQPLWSMPVTDTNSKCFMPHPASGQPPWHAHGACRIKAHASVNAQVVGLGTRNSRCLALQCVRVLPAVPAAFRRFRLMRPSSCQCCVSSGLPPWTLLCHHLHWQMIWLEAYNGVSWVPSLLVTHNVHCGYDRAGWNSSSVLTQACLDHATASMQPSVTSRMVPPERMA